MAMENGLFVDDLHILFYCWFSSSQPFRRKLIRVRSAQERNLNNMNGINLSTAFHRLSRCRQGFNGFNGSQARCWRAPPIQRMVDSPKTTKVGFLSSWDQPNLGYICIMYVILYMYVYIYTRGTLHKTYHRPPTKNGYNGY
jgi:hypothetical protein